MEDSAICMYICMCNEMFLGFTLSFSARMRFQASGKKSVNK